MLKSVLIEQVGEARYRRACVVAREAAERPDYGSSSRGHGDDASQVSQDLADALWASGAPQFETIQTLFELYDELPAYGLVMDAPRHHAAWPAAARRAFWDAVIVRLAGDDEALARPLAYTLWCDWFEREDRVREAWDALTGADIPPRALQHVLLSSGPVPWQAKTSLYARLLGTPRWHDSIFRSILRSVFDVYGKCDRADARAWLQRLELPPATEHLATLQGELASGPSKVRSWVRSWFGRPGDPS